VRLNHVTLIVLNLEARLRDPDGHQVRLYDAGVNRLNPPWRIDRK